MVLVNCRLSDNGQAPASPTHFSGCSSGGNFAGVSIEAAFSRRQLLSLKSVPVTFLFHSFEYNIAIYYTTTMRQYTRCNLQVCIADESWIIIEVIHPMYVDKAEVSYE
jgi:hypothetical protein